MWLPILLAAGLVCGAASTPPKHPRLTKIAGGQEATKGQFPWLVRLEVTNFEEGWLICGGSLINTEWVLIAAHCLEGESPEWLWIVSGEHDSSTEEGTEQILLIDYFVMHPEFDYWDNPFHNDIALMHLSTPATLDYYTQQVPMPHAYQEIIGPCREAGWGASGEGTESTVILNWAEVPLLTTADCEAAYNYPHDEKTLCAGNLAGGVGACVGDNGGALMCRDPATGSDVMAGVISWRGGCARPNEPAVYMQVSSYLDWILATIESPPPKAHKSKH